MKANSLDWHRIEWRPIKSVTAQIGLIYFVYILQVIQQLDLVECSIITSRSSASPQTESHLHQETLDLGSLDETGAKFNGIRLAPTLRCAEAERNLDECSAQLIGLGQRSLIFPGNMDELNSVYCPKFKSIVNCIKNSTECYKPFERQIINWILTSTRRMNFKRCRDENEKQRFLKLTTSCLANLKGPMDECMARYIGNLESIAGYVERVERFSADDFQIQLSCCANKRFKQCITNSARKTCPQSQENLKKLRRTNSNSSQRIALRQINKAKQDAMEDLKSTLDSMALTGPEFICNGITENFCKSKFDGRFNGRSLRYKSIVPAMIRIYSNE